MISLIGTPNWSKDTNKSRRSVSSLLRDCCPLTWLTAGSANIKIHKFPPSIRSRLPWHWTTPPSLSRTLDLIPTANGTERRPQGCSSRQHTTSSTAKSAWTSRHPPPRAHFHPIATGSEKSRLASSLIPVTWSPKGTNYLSRYPFSNSMSRLYRQMHDITSIIGFEMLKCQTVEWHVVTMSIIFFAAGTLWRWRFPPRRRLPRRASPPAAGTCTGTRWWKLGQEAASTMPRYY